MFGWHSHVISVALGPEPGPSGVGCREAGTGKQGRPEIPSVIEFPQHRVLEGELQSAVTLAFELLMKPKCAKLFGGMVLADATLNNLLQAGSIQFGAIQSFPGYTINATTTPIMVATPDDPSGSPWAIITINSVAGSFVSGNANSQVVTLLHELGHAENDEADCCDTAAGQRQSVMNSKKVAFDCL